MYHSMNWEYCSTVKVHNFSTCLQQTAAVHFPATSGSPASNHLRHLGLYKCDDFQLQRRNKEAQCHFKPCWHPHKCPWTVTRQADLHLGWFIFLYSCDELRLFTLYVRKCRSTRRTEQDRDGPSLFNGSGSVSGLCCFQCWHEETVY